MKSRNVIRKVEEEYITFVDGLDFSIKGKVLYNFEVNSLYNYSWEISHYCKGSKTAGTIYIPSDRTASNIEEARNRLLTHMKSFTTISVEANPYY